MTNNFFRVATVCPADLRVADPDNNIQRIREALLQVPAGTDLAVLPEMCITAYTCGDLFHNATLFQGAERALQWLLDNSEDIGCVWAVGLPVVVDGIMYNCAAIAQRGRLLAVVPKSYLPNYNEFYEKRWWQSGAGLPVRDIFLADQRAPFGVQQLVTVDGVRVAFEICEDLWTPIPPSCHATLAGAEVVANLSASNALVGKHDYLLNLVSQQSARCMCAYVYASAGPGESTTDTVFRNIGVIAENGNLLRNYRSHTNQVHIEAADIDIAAIRRDRMHHNSFADCARANNVSPYRNIIAVGQNAVEGDTTLLRTVNPHPFVPADNARLDERCTEIIGIQAAGLQKRLTATGCKTLVVGISGGLDSTLALLVAKQAFDNLGLDPKGIVGVTMPGFGTTGRTRGNAWQLMEAMGVTALEIPINAAVQQHFADIGHDPEVHDVTYENAQARQRTYLLMDLANQRGGMVLGTGDMSELALGWATYNGDHMSMYGVNAGVPKTLVRHLVRWFAMRNSVIGPILNDIIDTPISPELIPAAADGTIKQRTEDLVGPYELHDFFLYYTLRYGFGPDRILRLARHAFTPEEYADETILHWLQVFVRRFFNQQFKRSCMPDGPKVGSVCLSPRADWRMPSDGSSAAWQATLP